VLDLVCCGFSSLKSGIFSIVTQRIYDCICFQLYFNWLCALFRGYCFSSQTKKYCIKILKHYIQLVCHVYLLLFIISILARAATPSLCKPSLLTQMPDLPSTIATISSATRWANIVFPLPLLFLFDAASRIQFIAVQRLLRKVSGTGKARAIPPPAAPRC